MGRYSDGSAGDVDYGAIGRSYARHRQPDPAIARAIRDALGPARTVLNVGAGAGSYEPADLEVTAVEPSATMRGQRPPHLARAIDAVAEDLPFPDALFDAAMATSTVHQWTDLAAGIGELRRVTRGAIVLLVSDPDGLRRYWLNEYLPDAIEIEARRFPAIARLVDLLGPGTMVKSVPIPRDCTDGFAEAYFARPERFLDPEARGAMSSFTLVDPAVMERFVQRLGDDLASGEWDRRHGHLRTADAYEGSLRLVIRPASI